METSICTSCENTRKWCLCGEKMRGKINENEWEKEKVKDKGMRDERGERGVTITNGSPIVTVRQLFGADKG